MTIAGKMKLWMQLTTIARKEMDTSFIVDNQKSKIVREMDAEVANFGFYRVYGIVGKICNQVLRSNDIPVFEAGAFATQINV